MAETYQHHHQQIQNQQPIGPPRFRPKTSGAGGEIVEVQGGHIVRSTGRKDRHSKVCTSKGPRDRRVRLSAHTAIQFYDVQDRLGYDRPSKAVDWLIKKAKTAIDKLAELPAWKPTATVSRFTNPNETSIVDHFEQHPDHNIVDNQLGCSQNSSFLPPSLDSDSIADTIKSFFPVGGSSNPANNNSSSGMQYHQDLRLSLQSFKDPILHNHHQQQQQQQTHQVGSNSNTNNNIYFDGSGWPENQAGGFVFSSPAPLLQPLFGQTITNELFNNNSRREPLQSSSTTTPCFRAWIDPMPSFGIDQHPTLAFHHPASGLGGFSRFRVPARIQGAEERNGLFDRPSSASSDSRH